VIPAAAGACAALLALALAPAGAAASEVTPAELRDLAAQAASDPQARAELGRVERVGGRPAAPGAALSGAQGEDERARLRLLAEEVAARGPPDPRDARAEARAILEEPRFRETRLPRPLEGPLGWLGDRLSPARRALDDLVSAIDARLPGGRALVWVLLSGLVLVLATTLASRVIRRRVGAPGSAVRGAGSARARPEDLERAAEHAERSGDPAAAVRLRFQAGLLRLAEVGTISQPQAATTGEVAGRLRSAEFDALGAAFDAIVYGDRAATLEDARAARRGWSRVLEEAAR
jgi:hypothetical protein